MSQDLFCKTSLEHAGKYKKIHKECNEKGIICRVFVYFINPGKVFLEVCPCVV